MNVCVCVCRGEGLYKTNNLLTDQFLSEGCIQLFGEFQQRELITENLRKIWFILFLASPHLDSIQAERNTAVRHRMAMVVAQLTKALPNL